jgi:hypothetical protein
MNTIVEVREGRIGNLLAFLLMIGLSAGLIILLGGIGGWFFAVLFFIASLLPLDSLVRPETAVITLDDGVLNWHVTRQGKKTERGSLPVRDIQKITRIETAGRRMLSVEIELETRNGKKVFLPMSLHLSVNGDRILSALKEANLSIPVEERKEP